jgi:hypothetical protein
MAGALNEGRTILGAEAIAERPHGTRVSFAAPYPAPLKDGSGGVIGATSWWISLLGAKGSSRLCY